MGFSGSVPQQNHAIRTASNSHIIAGTRDSQASRLLQDFVASVEGLFAYSLRESTRYETQHAELHELSPDVIETTRRRRNVRRHAERVHKKDRKAVEVAHRRTVEVRRLNQKLGSRDSGATPRPNGG